jgi:hypothetical protein
MLARNVSCVRITFSRFFCFDGKEASMTREQILKLTSLSSCAG